MKQKLCVVLILFFILSAFLIFEYKESKLEGYKLLRVEDGCVFYIDFNKNNKIDDNEKVVLADVDCFSLNNLNKIKYYSKKLGIKEIDCLKLAYIARSELNNLLLNKTVFVQKRTLRQKYAKFYFEHDKKDVEIGEFLVSQGFAYPKYLAQRRLLSFLSFEKVYENIDKFDKLQNPEKLEITSFIESRGLKSRFYLNGAFDKKYKHKAKYNVGFEHSKRSYKISVYRKFGNIEVFLLNPLEFSGPQSSCKTKACLRLLDEIKNAKKSIDIALYGFGEQREIFETLKQRKDDIKINSVIDYSADTLNFYTYTNNFSQTFNSTNDVSKSFMHNKFFIFDENKVFTGSSNISSSGIAGYNANIAFMINSKCLAELYGREFEQMRKGKFHNKKEIIEPIVCKVDESTINTYFLPKYNFYENRLLGLIRSAKEEILISAFFLTDKRLIDELIRKRQEGVKILIILDASGASKFKDRVKKLRENGIFVKIENWGGKNHEKTILIDKKVLISGSMNFSYNGLFKNDENVLVFESKEISEFYRDYFLFLFNSIDKKYLWLYPRAEGKESINSCFDGIDNNFDGLIDKNDPACR